MAFPKVLFWVHCCFHFTTPLAVFTLLHHLAKSSAFIRILSSTSMRTTHSYISISHKNASAALAKLSACLHDVQRWMSLSKLKLNPETTEFIIFGSKAQRQKISSHFPVSILGSLLHLIDLVRNLGVWFDAEFSFSEHVKRTCKACFLQMCDLRRYTGLLKLQLVHFIKTNDKKSIASEIVIGK